MADPNTDAQESPNGEDQAPDEQDGPDTGASETTEAGGTDTPFGDDPQELQGDDAGSGGS